MIINQAPVTAHNTSERDYVERWHVNEIAFSARFVRLCKTPGYFANCERRGCDIIEHSRICVSMDERCPGKISCICGEPAIPPVRRQRTEARRIPRIRERSRGRLIDNVSEGTFYRVLVYTGYLAAAPDALSAADSLTNLKSMLAGTWWRFVICHDFSIFSINVNPIVGMPIKFLPRQILDVIRLGIRFYYTFIVLMREKDENLIHPNFICLF